jgi:hypothetical protein
MSAVALSTTGLEMPKDFNVAAYESIHGRMGANKARITTWDDYLGAWCALSYRYLSCAESDEVFTESIKIFGPAPPLPQRYLQERELFSFFVLGLSTIESLTYGFYAVISVLDPTKFPLNNDNDRRYIYPESTCTKLTNRFPTEPISKSLASITSSKEYDDWKNLRNMLAHRTLPGRNIRIVPGGAPLPALWAGIEVDVNTTALRRRWLAGKVFDLLRDIDLFISNYF